MASRGRILIVDDTEVNRLVLQEMLTEDGALVTLAASGREAIEAIRCDRGIQIVLMDVQMPVMDGYAASRSIRQDLGMATLPIIAMTANAMAADRTACLEAGMDEHIGKPFELDHLVATLLRLCRSA